MGALAKDDLAVQLDDDPDCHLRVLEVHVTAVRADATQPAEGYALFEPGAAVDAVRR